MNKKSLQLALALAAAASPVFAQTSLELLWHVPPVNATTFPDSNNLTRGGAFNPITGNLLVATRAGGTGVRILDGATGAEKGTLNMTGVSGGTFALNMIGVGSDGAIYGCNLVTAASDASPFKVYRWADETSAPTVVYSGNPGGGRFGDSFAVRGGGSSTEIVVGEGGTGARMIHIGTADGAAFTANVLTVTGLTAGDLRLGLDFGPGASVYGKQTGPLRWISYDLAGGTAAVAESYTLTSPLGGTPAPLGIAGDALVAYATGNSSAQAINLYSLSALTASANNAPIDSELLPTANANANVVGAVDFNADGSVVYLIAPNNGVSAFAIVPEPETWALLGAGSVLVLWAARRRG